MELDNSFLTTGTTSAYTTINWISGILGKQEQEQEQKTGMGTCKNHCYSSTLH